MPAAGRRLAQLERVPVSELKAVPARKVAGLAEMEIRTVLDLLTHYPRRYVDRTNQARVAELTEEVESVVTAEVQRSSSRRLRGGKSMAEIVVADETGMLTCVFFNQGWRARQFRKGETVTVIGRLTYYRGRAQMSNPVVDLVGDQAGRIVPIYPQSPKAAITSVELSRYVAEALDRAKEFAEPLPGAVLAELGLMGRTEAMRSIHRPEANEDHVRARRRLVFDELLRLQVLLVSRRRAAAAAAKGIAHRVDGALLRQYLDRLPFALTGAQERAIAEIRADLAAPEPMNRLLQGDVGAGKTVVALAALLVGIEGGYQGAFMVPTEVLAEQHFLAARHLLDGLVVADPSRLGGERPLAVELLTNKTTGAERTRIVDGLANGGVDLVVGTHALIAEGISFARLGVVVVDEQHRFGVEQRAALREKAAGDPDLLVMTATPIPRTAAMTVYGDLDHTTLDELPPGRTPITTRWLRGDGQEQAAWKKVRDEVAAGHQAYVVCARVGGTGAEDEEAPDDPDLDDDALEEAAWQGQLVAPGDLGQPRRPPRSAIGQLEQLASGPLHGLRLGLLHGQLPAKEKEAAMAAFRAGEIDVLVATTVVEVGVDVTNATVMVIEDADRFGIAQLHQLRGRVGRGLDRSWCLLLTTDEVSDQAASRLAAVVASQNGFELAEEDLVLRGGGTVLGARQKGRSDLKLVDFRRDRELIERAREVALRIVEADPELAGEFALVREELGAIVSDEEAAFLFRS